MCEPPLPQFKIRLPKRGKRKRMALWNGHRPVSCQGHLCLEDKLWAMMERGEWAELFLNNLVILGYRCGRISKSSMYLSPLSACILTDKQGVSLPPTKWPYVSFPPLAVTHFTWHQSGKCEVKSLCACMWLQMCLCMSLYVHVWGVRMIQSAISLCEDSLHKHTRHAEDVVILRLIVCVSDVSNHHQTRGGFTLPLSLSFSAFSSNCTNCPIVLLLLRSHISSITLCSRGCS